MIAYKKIIKKEERLFSSPFLGNFDTTYLLQTIHWKQYQAGKRRVGGSWMSWRNVPHPH